MVHLNVFRRRIAPLCLTFVLTFVGTAGADPPLWEHETFYAQGGWFRLRGLVEPGQTQYWYRAKAMCVEYPGAVTGTYYDGTWEHSLYGNWSHAQCPPNLYLYWGAAEFVVSG